MSDIFKVFKNSIEQVQVKNPPRGTLSPEPAVFNVSLDALVKRRYSMAESVNESEDYENRISLHFRSKDAQYIKEGYYVKVDEKWHSIEEIRDGKNFDSGKQEFIYVFLASDILPEGEDPVWT